MACASSGSSHAPTASTALVRLSVANSFQPGANRVVGRSASAASGSQRHRAAACCPSPRQRSRVACAACSHRSARTCSPTGLCQATLAVKGRAGDAPLQRSLSSSGNSIVGAATAAEPMCSHADSTRHDGWSPPRPLLSAVAGACGNAAVMLPPLTFALVSLPSAARSVSESHLSLCVAQVARLRRGANVVSPALSPPPMGRRASPSTMSPTHAWTWCSLSRRCST